MPKVPARLIVTRLSSRSSLRPRLLRGVSGVLGRRARSVLAGVSISVFASAGLAACGGPPASKALTLSVTSGPPGTVVDVSGKAGGGCTAGTNWFGFDFEPAGPAKGLATQMTTPVSKNGSWSGTFVVPAYLGGSGKSGPGGPTKPGRYQLVAQACRGHVVATANFRVTSGQLPSSSATGYVGIVSTPDGAGYWLVRADGTVTAYGDARSYGSLPAGKALAGGRVVGMARTYDSHGYWLATADGDVYGFGDARPYGSLVSEHLSPEGPVVGIAATPHGNGYWLLSESGHVYRFGAAPKMGMPSSHLAPFDAIAGRPGGGYIVTAADDQAVYLFPGGQLASGGPGAAQSTTLVGAASTPSGNGTWLAGMDGGVYTWGDAGFYNSVIGLGETLSAPVTAIAGSPDARGYWLLGADGHVYTFGDAKVFSPASG